MGNIIPSNKTMVDQLVDEVTLSPRVEGAFRAVDRAIYYETSGDKVNPYQMSPWRDGNLHISAPFIYAKVVEALDLKPGMSFLNLGSGTGYLSTVVGLLIAPQGINHGVEVHDQVVKYAQRKLVEFLATSSAIDKFEFVEPVFIHGNCVDLDPNRQYDRVYLGAACLPGLEKFMKRLIKPNGGILIMPIRNELILYRRLTDNQWEKQTLENGVEFTFMRCRYHADDKQMLEMPLECVPSLKRLCREAIRRQLRLKTDLMHPNLLNSDNVERRRHRRSVAMKRAEERYLKQSRMQSNLKSSQASANSRSRKSSACIPSCSHEIRPRASCRQKRSVPRAGAGPRIMTRQATRQVQSGTGAREMAGGTSSSSYADIISDLDGNTERNDDDDEDDDSENAFLPNSASIRRIHQAQTRHFPESAPTSQPTSSRACPSVDIRESLLTTSDPCRQSESRRRDVPARESMSSALGNRFDFDQILMDPALRSSIRRSRFFSPTLDGVRTAQLRLNQSIHEQNDQQRIESALWRLMHRANRWRSPPPRRHIHTGEDAPNSAIDDFRPSPMDHVHRHQEEEIDRILLALYWAKFLRLALGDSSDQDEEDDQDFLSPTRESSTESLNHSSSASSSSLDSDCPSNSSSLSTSSFGSSDNGDCGNQDDVRQGISFATAALSSSQDTDEQPVASRLRSKRLHLNSSHSLNTSASSSGSGGSSFHSAVSSLRPGTTAAEVLVKPATSIFERPKRGCCERHQCFRQHSGICHRSVDQQQSQHLQQAQHHQRLAYSRRGELEPYAGARHLSPTFMSSGANLSIERRILLASGFNLHRTGASLSLVNASRSVQQEMRQPILFMNALARSSENWSAPSWESIDLCRCVDTFRSDDHMRPSSQQRAPQAASPSGPLGNRALVSMSERSRHHHHQQQQQLGYLGLMGYKRKRHSSDSDSTGREDVEDDDYDEDYRRSPSALPSCSRRRLHRSTRPLFQEHAAGNPRGSAVASSIELARSASLRVCSDGSGDLRSSGSSVQGVAYHARSNQMASLDGCDSIKSTDDDERLGPPASRSLSGRSTSGAAPVANIDDGQQRPGAPLGRQACQHHQRQHASHHCRHHHKHHHHHAHCHHRRGAGAFAVAGHKHRCRHHCKRHRHCCQRNGRQTNHQAPGERPSDFHVRRRVERERRHAAVQNGRSSSARRPSRRPANECEKYRSHISSYIRQLDLPAALLDYLNYDREFE